ncbi:hypothetical protein [Patiriisocius hiemis]|uniref:Secreted protein n=1 Tax=Patiriisocius hiemis TaxID=3075604 RepID=A0ABU2YAI5_9FLAO|nr:hypothetical protein [Constantimarinum sp. W242]MDT0555199.1 hypothetical protein [Constantimarinum sp. W242]
MKTIYILITALFLSTTSSYAQLEGLLGDIMEEVQEKVGDAQQDAAETASMKEFKNELKEILAGINGLDKYSSELKCIYLILKLASLDQGLEAKIQNAGNCKKKYDLYGMQLMVKASYTGIGYCFDSLTELLDESNSSELLELIRDYIELKNLAIDCIEEYGPNLDSCKIPKGTSKLERDFIMTVGSAITTYDTFSDGIDDESWDNGDRISYILKLLSYLVEEYNPVSALAKSIEIGANMSALPCK